MTRMFTGIFAEALGSLTDRPGIGPGSSISPYELPHAFRATTSYTAPGDFRFHPPRGMAPFVDDAPGDVDALRDVNVFGDKYNGGFLGSKNGSVRENAFKIPRHAGVARRLDTFPYPRRRGRGGGTDVAVVLRPAVRRRGGPQECRRGVEGIGAAHGTARSIVHPTALPSVLKGSTTQVPTMQCHIGPAWRFQVDYFQQCGDPPGPDSGDGALSVRLNRLSAGPAAGNIDLYRFRVGVVPETRGIW